MQQEERYLTINDFYQKKRDLFANEIRNLPVGKQGSKFEIKNCAGTYFQLLDYSKISLLPDMQFAEYMTKEVGVAVIPLSPFYEKQQSQPIIRVCFAKTDEVLKQAAKKLVSLQKDMSGCEF
jgi:methionine aminotransferase